MRPAVPSGRLLWSWRLWLASLFTLPAIGVGVLKLATGRDFGGGLQPSWLLAGLSLLLAAPEVALLLKEHRRVLARLVLPLLGALLLSALGIWLAPSGEDSGVAFGRWGKQVVQVLIMAAFVIAPIWHLHSGRPLAAMAVAIVAGALGQVGYGALQAITFQHQVPAMAWAERVFTSNPSIFAGSGQLYLGNVLRDIPRLRGTACEPLYLGNFLLLALPLVALTPWRARWRGLAAAAMAVLLLLTWSRGAWLAGAAAALVLLLTAHRAEVRLPWRQLGRTALAVGGVLAVGAAVGAMLGRAELLLPLQRLQQTVSTVDWSNLTRLYSMQAAWRAFLLSPLFGIGWGQFAFHFASLVDPLGLQSMFTWPVVNNFPLEILSETGLVGIAASVWAALGLARIVRRRLAALPAPGRLPLLLVAVGVCAIWLQLLTFSQYNLPHIWVAIGLLAGEASRGGRQLEEVAA